MSVDAALALLAEHPEGLTSAEVAEALGVTQPNAGAILSRLRRQHRAYIAGWQTDHPGARKYPRARYALGDRPEARKPRVDIVGRHRQQHHLRAARSITSVFDLGIPVCDRINGRRALRP